MHSREVDFLRYLVLAKLFLHSAKNVAFFVTFYA